MINSTIDFIPWSFESPPVFEPLWFEKVDDPAWKKYMKENQNLPFFVSILYLVVIFGLQSFMRNRVAFKLQKLLIFWNWTLGIFSICGMYRMAQELFYVLSLPNGFHRSVCLREGLNEPTAFWGLLFTLSKFVELGDTLFIVLRKQPLIFLQWYHHCITMIFVWQVIPYSEPIQRWYGVMNYGVHGIMYPYFALRAMKITVPRTFALTLTSLQLTQMIVGITVNVYSLYIIGNGQFCARDPVTLKWSFGVYSSFALLFADFLINRYFLKKTKKID